MRAHLLRERKRAIWRRPREHQGTRCAMTHPGGAVRSCGEGGHTIDQQLAVGRQYSVTVSVREKVKLESAAATCAQGNGFTADAVP
eukprot:859125-Prymnesium_polylepis.1